MDYFRHQKYKNKQLTNNFRSINISINEMDKFEKKIQKHLQKILAMIGMIGYLSPFLSL